MTVNVSLAAAWSRDDLIECYREFYAGEKLLSVTGDMPEVAEIQEKHGCIIGGFALADGGRRVVLVSVLDNLLKGAATQALQNANLALGLDEFSGIDVSSAC
jgi:N-acetyl-gamma-glutamyl-phosphate reductase